MTMQDRFKFRVWNDMQKCYSADDHYISEDGFINTIGDYVLEQCTGLHDNNDKLIYEGDWLKTKDGYYCYVVWFEGFWWVKSLPSEAMDFEHSEFYGECEVIGNIHENADLLENKDESM